MATLSGTSQEQRRWLVVGIALHHVLTPCLRDKIKAEMTPFYQHLVRRFGLDKQTYSKFLKNIPLSTVNLNYESINNNDTAKHRSHYDYCVKDKVSLAKLFMKPFMAQFNAFNSSFDSSAALAVLCGALPFVTVKAEDVRSKVRNEWAHIAISWPGLRYTTTLALISWRTWSRTWDSWTPRRKELWVILNCGKIMVRIVTVYFTPEWYLYFCEKWLPKLN